MPAMASPTGYCLPRSAFSYPAGETAQPTMNMSDQGGLNNGDVAAISPLSPTFGSYFYGTHFEGPQYPLPPGFTGPAYTWIQAPSSISEAGHYPAGIPDETGEAESVWHADDTLPRQPDGPKEGRPPHASRTKKEPDHPEGDEPLSNPKRSRTKLRTASRTSKRNSLPAKRGSTGSAAEVKAKATHNQVEQQYRKRLNSQFEQLLAVLPVKHKEGYGAMTDVTDGGRERMRLSKAEVLDLARERIKTLEHQSATLENDKKLLLSRLEALQVEWARTTRDRGH